MKEISVTYHATVHVFTDTFDSISKKFKVNELRVL